MRHKIQLKGSVKISTYNSHPFTEPSRETYYTHGLIG